MRDVLPTVSLVFLDPRGEILDPFSEHVNNARFSYVDQLENMVAVTSDE